MCQSPQFTIGFSCYANVWHLLYFNTVLSRKQKLSQVFDANNKKARSQSTNSPSYCIVLVEEATFYAVVRTSTYTQSHQISHSIVEHVTRAESILKRSSGVHKVLDQVLFIDQSTVVSWILGYHLHK